MNCIFFVFHRQKQSLRNKLWVSKDEMRDVRVFDQRVDAGRVAARCQRAAIVSDAFISPPRAPPTLTIIIALFKLYCAIFIAAQYTESLILYQRKYLGNQTALRFVPIKDATRFCSCLSHLQEKNSPYKISYITLKYFCYNKLCLYDYFLLLFIEVQENTHGVIRMQTLTTTKHLTKLYLTLFIINYFVGIDCTMKSQAETFLLASQMYHQSTLLQALQRTLSLSQVKWLLVKCRHCRGGNHPANSTAHRHLPENQRNSLATAFPPARPKSLHVVAFSLHFCRKVRVGRELEMKNMSLGYFRTAIQFEK